MVGLINYLIIYLVIGGVFMAFIDINHILFLRNHPDYEELGDFTNKDRVAIILLWPYSMYVFIKGFIKGE